MLLDGIGVNQETIVVQPFPVFAGLVDILLFDNISAIDCANDGFSATIRTFTISSDRKTQTTKTL